MRFLGCERALLADQFLIQVHFSRLPKVPARRRGITISDNERLIARVLILEHRAFCDIPVAMIATAYQRTDIRCTNDLDKPVRPDETGL